MARGFRLAALLLIAATPALTAGQAPQPPPTAQAPTFQTGVEYVEVDVLASDRQGRFVPDLKKEDFEVREDGKMQSIATFSTVNIPIDRAERPLFASRPIEPDVRTNEHPFDGRIYVLVLDDLHTASARTARVKSAARSFVEQRLGANDLMAVVSVGGRSDTTQEFTNSKRLLLAAVDRFVGRKLESATLQKNDQALRQSVVGDSSLVNDPQDAERLANAETTLRRLRDVAEWFGGVHGRRKTVLFLSEGIDYDVSELIPQNGSTHAGATAVLQEMSEAIGAAQRSNVAIYSVDPRGLASGLDDAAEVSGFADQNSRSIGQDADSAGTAPRTNFGTRDLMNEVRLSQDTLRRLSDDTGGLAIVNRNDYAAAFDRIVGDNSSYYVLAYYPPSDKRDGKFHKIEVRVKRPGVTVRARRGYNSPRGKAPAPAAVAPGAAVREAVNSPLPLSGLTMSLFAAPFKGVAPNASVLFGVEMRGRDLNLSANDAVELTYLAADEQGKTRAGTVDRITLNLRPETKERVEQSGLRVLNRLDLAPGRYQLRVASHDTVGGALGSVIYDLEVPDFYKQPFSLSGLVLTSLGGASMPTARPDEQLRAVLPAPPIASRTFPQNDEIALFAEVYDNEGSAPHKVDIATTITSDEGKVVFKNEQQRDSSELEGQRGGYGYAARVPLSDFTPGLYVLKVAAQSRFGGTPKAEREVLIHITPRTQ